MLRIYGWKKSRTARCMWVMEELGLSYEQVPLNPHAGETRTPEYLALNPAGKIPTLVHDDFVLTETIAINFYLASSFPGTLLPKDPRGVARVLQWTSWGLSELEPQAVAMMREGRRPPEQIDRSRIEAAKTELHRMLDVVLEPALQGREYLIAGAGFTLADLNVAAMASALPMFDVSFEPHPAVNAWMKRCLGREAYQRAQSRA